MSKVKHKITFNKPISLFWNDLTDLDGYTQDNEKAYFPKNAWKKQSDSLIVEIVEKNDTIYIKDFEAEALFPELYDVCSVEKVVDYYGE